MSPHQAFSSDLSYRLGWTVIHSLWQGCLAVAALVPVLWLLRQRSPQARYCAACATMGITVVGAIITFSLLQRPTPPSMNGRLDRTERPVTTISGAVAAAKTPGLRATHAAAVGSSDQSPGKRVNPSAAFFSQELPLLRWVSGAWVLGVLLLSAWHTGGWLSAQRLKVAGIQPAGPALVSAFARVSRPLGMERSARTVQSLLAKTPMVIGWLRPVVLMPVAVVAELTPPQLEAILAHELAHIRRHDYLLNLLQVVIETLLFYHPAVWWMSRQIRLEREQCCDEIAAAICGDRCAYAESLAAVEEVRLGGAVALAASGAGGAQLLRRIRRLLGLPEDARRRSARAIAAAAIWLATALAAVVGPRVVGSAATGPATQSAPLPATRPAALKPAVLLVTDGNYFLERSLAAASPEDVAVLTIKPAQFEANRNDHSRNQVIVFDRWAPKVAPSAPSLYFGILPPGSDLVDRDAAGHAAHVKDASVVESNREHPTVRDLDLSRLYVAEALKLHAADHWETLARGKEGPLILAHNDVNRQILIAFDLKQSNWPMEVSFPMFMRRSIQWLMGREPAATRQSADPIAPAPEHPVAEPQTRPAAEFRADCTLSASVDGKRQVLASATLNLQDGGESSFLFTGRPPVIIQQLPSHEAGILATVSIQKESDGRLRVVGRISRRVSNGDGNVADDDRAAMLERARNLQAIERRKFDAELLELAAEKELSYRQGKGKFGARPYTAQEITRADLPLADKLKELDITQMRLPELRDTYGANYPGVLVVKKRLETLQKSVDEYVKQFNEDYLIVTAPDGQPAHIVSKDLSKLRAVVLTCRQAEERERAALNEIQRAGGIQTDQTIKPGEPVAVELDDGTRLEVSVHPAVH